VLKKFAVLSVLASSLCISNLAQANDNLFKQIPDYLPASFDLYRQMLSIPNDAHHPKQVRRNIEFMQDAFERRQFKVSKLKTEGAPLLLAERKMNNQLPTVLIYLQLDGQPVDPSKWHQADPYVPALKQQDGEQWVSIPFEKLLASAPNPDWRIFARSASDAKGPVAMLLTALDIFNDANQVLPYNLKVVMDFEEELGSPYLPKAVQKHSEALSADMLLIYDGPLHSSNQPTLDFGARGIVELEFTVHGPRAPLHSGHFGNYAPNPALQLSQLLSSMKDENGRTTIPGFYDGIKLDESTLAILAQTPDDEVEIKRRIGIADTDKVAPTYQQSIQYPSLNIRGMKSGWVGKQARTIVPDTATATLDIRLVPESDPERLISLIKQHAEKQGYYLIGNRVPTEKERLTKSKIVSFSHRIAYQAFRTPYDSEVGLWLNKTLTKVHGESPVRIRQSGGSIPISPFVVELGVPAVGVPTVNGDNNQHSPNENIRVGNYIDGIRTYLGILSEPIGS